jgi:hypothetical protein
MYLARLETKNFTFETFANSKTEALDQLKRGLTTHGKQRHVNPDWWVEWIEDVYTLKIKMGCTYRDRSIIRED